MNHSPERNYWPRASKFVVVAMSLLCILAIFVPALSAQIVAPAGSVIGNQASATYLDANSVSRTAFSNLVQTTVTQVYGGTLTAAQTKYGTPGSQVMFPHTYTNSGNGTDSVIFTTGTVNAALTNVHIYMDANGDGIPDNTTDLTSTSLPIASLASIKVVVVATLAPGTVAGSYAMTLTATPPHSAAQANIDTVTESSGAVISVTKSMTAPVAGVSTVTLAYTNTGNATATAVTIMDTLHTQGYFSYVPGTAKWNGVSFTDVVAPPAVNGGLTWGVYTAASDLSAVIASVATGVSGTISFNVTVGVPASYPATFTNFGQFNYNDGVSGVVPGAASYINTNTVSLPFSGSAAVKFTSGTAVFTTGLPASGTPNTSPAKSIIASASYNQGATITWSQTLTNNGQVTDTYNLTLDTVGAGTTLDPTIVAANQFPAGTTFQLYRADGKTPLTDSNGDGVVDGGPVAGNGTVTVVVAATLPASTTISASTTYIVNLVATSTNSTASNFTAPGLQDVVQNEVIISSTKNAVVDLAANAGDTIGNGAGVSGEAAGPYSGNPGVTIAVPFWIFNTTTTSAPDAYNLSFRYNGTAAVGLISPVTPFTSAQAGTVPPSTSTSIPAWTVLIAPNTGVACSTYGAPVTASSVIAAAGNAEYCLLLQVPASYAANTYHFTIQAQSNSTGAIDQMAVQATVNTFHNVSLSPNNQATIYAGGTVTYKHVITNGGNVTETATITLNTPTFQAAPAGWTMSVYADSDLSGKLDSGDASVVTPSTTSLAAGASLTYFIVVQAPASANPGDVQLGSWTITVPSNNSAAVTSVTDTSTVVSGQVKLVKAAFVDTACSVAQGSWTTQTYLTSVQNATSKQCIIYQIQATNTGTLPISTLVIADTAPPYTAITGTELENVAATGCTGLTTGVVTTPAGPSFTAPFTGPMPAGCVATVYFEVKLN